jgi:Arc/MetJ family transcription regulator
MIRCNTLDVNDGLAAHPQLATPNETVDAALRELMRQALLRQLAERITTGSSSGRSRVMVHRMRHGR